MRASFAPVAVLALGLSGLVAACPPPAPTPDAGPDDIDDAGPGEPELDVATFCAGFHGAVCDGFSSCGCTLEGRGFDLTDCASERAAACEAALGEAVPALAEGTIAFDEERVDACLAGVAGLIEGCERLDATTLPLTCALFLVDDVALGGACTLSSVAALCAGGAGLCTGERCEPLPADPAPPPPPVDVGGACASTDVCARGLACIGGACEPGPARGDGCDGPSCASGDACVRDYDSRVCTQPLVEGDACARDSECEDGLYCDGTCTLLPLENESCTSNLECAAPFLCDAEGGLLCITAPGEGQACTIGSALCAPGLGCNVDNLCVVPPGVGEECLLPQLLCAPGLACDFTADGSFCAERRGEGGECQNDAVCADGLFCGDGGACVPTLSTGTPCPTGGGCGADDECSDLAGGFTCQPRPGEDGDACYFECGNDLTCIGPGGVCAPGLCASP